MGSKSKVILLLVLLMASPTWAIKIDISRTTAATTEATTISTTQPTTVVQTTPTSSVAPETSPEEASSTTTSPISGTSSTATSPSNPTTTALSSNETQEEEPSVPEWRTRGLLPNYHCECDILINACDTNCCCDIDCPPAAITSFECTTKHPSEEGPNYLSGYGLPPCSVSSSWFCVVNVDLKTDRHVHWSFDNANKLNHKKWPESFLVQPKVTYIHEKYRFNDDLLIFNEVTEDMDHIKLPVSLFDVEDCHFRDNVRFLKNQKSQCKGVANLLSEGIFTNLSNWRVLSDPRFDANMMSEHCAELGPEFCIPFQIVVCNGSCVAINETGSIEPSVELSSIRFEFLHNFTNIKEARISLHVFNQDSHETKDRIEVIFTEEPKNNTLFFRASGNVGYANGKPLLVSQYSMVNVTEFQESMSINFFAPGNNQSHVLSLPRVDECGNCLGREDLLFNENSLTQCNLKLEKRKVDNVTEMCRGYQRKILHLLYHTNSSGVGSLLVSQFGNPRNDTSKWIRMEIPSALQLDGIVGESQEGSFVCRNMILELELRAMYAKLTDDVSGSRHQSLIQKVSLGTGPQLDLAFSLSEEVVVPVTIKVVFLDLTSTSSSAPRIVVHVAVFISFLLQMILLGH